jgi:hypothetical protein
MSSEENTIQDLKSQIKDLEDILFEPGAYRDAYKDNTGNDIFEVLKTQIVSFAKETPSFKEFLISSLDLSSKRSPDRESKRSPVRSSPVRSSTRARAVGSIIKSPAIFTPKSSRGRSRPVLETDI